MPARLGSPARLDIPSAAVAPGRPGIPAAGEVPGMGGMADGIVPGNVGRLFAFAAVLFVVLLCSVSSPPGGVFGSLLRLEASATPGGTPCGKDHPAPNWNPCPEPSGLSSRLAPEKESPPALSGAGIMDQRRPRGSQLRPGPGAGVPAAELLP
mmetsp:Transcript_53600/g.159978  ORF Transcript_53600/g.159978 Transcript_53600/m.159978 type:complete len:153 (-) Transcript_53600:8-466(-)